MKKLISILSVLILLISTISCRFQDEDFDANESGNIKDLQSAYSRNSDSIKTNNLEEGDPPPKNGTQWRTGK